MTDIVDIARERLNREDGRIRTHSDDCPRWHDACLISRLVDDIEMLRLLVPPIAGTLDAKTGMDFIPWSVAASTSHASYYSTPVLPKGFEPRRLDGWIPTSDRLPADGEMVLWWSPKSDFCKCILGKRDGESINWGGDLNSSLTRVTHWRPLPGPPTAIVK